MYAEGQLLSFTPFVFKNGALPKKKFFIVLKNMDDRLVMASLPTSKDHLPSNVPLTSGCVNIPERAVNAFVFMPEDWITDCFAFRKPTFVYGEQVDEYAQIYLDSMDSTIEDLGIIHRNVFENLKDCLKQSLLLKRKFRKLL